MFVNSLVAPKRCKIGSILKSKIPQIIILKTVTLRRVLLKIIDALLVSPCPISLPLTTLLPMASISESPNKSEKIGKLILIAANPEAPT